jgi:hypothetical protein
MRQRLFQSALAREQRREARVGGRSARLEGEHTAVACFGGREVTRLAQSIAALQKYAQAARAKALSRPRDDGRDQSG